MVVEVIWRPKRRDILKRQDIRVDIDDPVERQAKEIEFEVHTLAKRFLYRLDAGIICRADFLQSIGPRRGALEIGGQDNHRWERSAMSTERFDEVVKADEVVGFVPFEARFCQKGNEGNIHGIRSLGLESERKGGTVCRRTDPQHDLIIAHRQFIGRLRLGSRVFRRFGE